MDLAVVQCLSHQVALGFGGFKDWISLILATHTHLIMPYSSMSHARIAL